MLHSFRHSDIWHGAWCGRWWRRIWNSSCDHNPDRAKEKQDWTEESRFCLKIYTPLYRVKQWHLILRVDLNYNKSQCIQFIIEVYLKFKDLSYHHVVQKPETTSENAFILLQFNTKMFLTNHIISIQ